MLVDILRRRNAKMCRHCQSRYELPFLSNRKSTNTGEDRIMKKKFMYALVVMEAVEGLDEAYEEI